MPAIYDLIIRGGTIVDGSGSEPFVADIAVRGGRIAKIGAVPRTASEEIRRIHVAISERGRIQQFCSGGSCS